MFFSRPSLSLILGPVQSKVFILPAGASPQIFHIEGYMQRFQKLIYSCSLDRMPIFLGGYLPLNTEICSIIEDRAGKGLRIWANHQFMYIWKKFTQIDASFFLLSSSTPLGAFPITLFTLIRNPVWQLFERLAIPLPGRIVICVEDNIEHKLLNKESTSIWFAHFLDSGGHIEDLVRSKDIPPFMGLASELQKTFPTALFIEPADASLIGTTTIFSGVEDKKWIHVWTDENVTRIYILQGYQVLAGAEVSTKNLNYKKLNDYIAQLIGGRKINEEISFDGGHFAETRVIAENFSSWEPLVISGNAADRFSQIEDALIFKGKSDFTLIEIGSIKILGLDSLLIRNIS